MVDRVKTIDAYPAEETLANILVESRQNGGAAFNVLIDLAKLGATFPLEGLGCIGEDADGEFVMQTCLENGIDSSRVLRVSDRTSYTDVMTVRGSGKRTFFHHRGANARLAQRHFDFSRTQAQHLHLGYLMLLDALDESDTEYGTRAARVLADAQSQGLSTSVDLVSGQADQISRIVWPALKHVDVFFLNELELSRLTGVELTESDGVESIRVATDLVFDDGYRGTIAVHSARFGYVRDAYDREHFRESVPLQPEQIKGTVGAGDAFAAGFLFAHLEGHDPRICLQWGVAAGASCLLGEGASNGVLPIQDALNLAGQPNVG